MRKFHIIRCTGCELKCTQTLPITFDLEALLYRYNHKECETHKAGQGIKLKVRGSSHEVNPNDPCICGSGKKFKKCCMQNLKV